MAIYDAPESLHVGTGTETVFGFNWPYLLPRDLLVTLNGFPVPTVLASPNQVVIAPAPAAGVIVRIYRNTPAQNPTYLFASGLPMLPRYIDGNNKQLLYALQEGLLEFSKVAQTADEAKAMSQEAMRLAGEAAISAAQQARDMRRTVRVPTYDPEIPTLPPVAARASRMMGFDAAGNPVGVIPISGSAAEVVLDLANPVDLYKGAGMVGRGSITLQHVGEFALAPRRTDLTLVLKTYLPGGSGGYGVFSYDETMPRAKHNGGTVHSPTVPWGGVAQLATYLKGTGDTAGLETGCWVRRWGNLSVDCFGAQGGTVDDTAAFEANHEASQPIILTRPEYTISRFRTTSVRDFELRSDVFSRLNVTRQVEILNKSRVLMHNVDYDFTQQPDTEVQGIFMQFCEDVNVTRNRMRHPWKSALVVWDSTGGVIANNRIFDTGRGKQYNGIVPLGCGVIVYGCQDMDVTKNWMRDIWQIPVFVSGNTGHSCYDIIVSTNLLRSNNDNGIRIQPDDPAHLTCHDVLVANNIVMGTSRADCIRLSGPRNSAVGNKVNGAGSTGIDAQYAQDSLIDANLIYGCAEGIALTSFEVITNNVAITNNHITDCFGNSAAITVTNDGATGGSFRNIRIASNKITKRTGLGGSTRAIAVSMMVTTGNENVVISENDIDGYDVFGITCTNLRMVIVQNNVIGGVRMTAVAAIQIQDCYMAIVTGNKDRGNLPLQPAAAIRLGGNIETATVLGNVMPYPAIGLSTPGTIRALYRNGNHFSSSVITPYVFTGVGGQLRELANNATTQQIVQFLYTLVGDMGSDAFIRR